jgi:halogenation protein CepH
MSSVEARETNTEEFDVIVVGGGPSGSAAASLVAKQGHRVLLLEKEFFPRYQIGESLLPSTVRGVCGLLGVSEELERASFVVKRGGTFLWGANPDPWRFTFNDAFPGHADEVTAFQVERMKFDDILLKNARKLGVEVREGCTVSAVIDDDERVRGVRYRDADGVERTVSSQFVVDASGNGSRLFRSVAGRHYSEFFKNIALFGYFENGKRQPPPHSGNILSATFEDGWFWYIPLNDRLTSVGAVVRHDLADRVQGDREAALDALIKKCPMVSEYLADAKRVTEGPYGEIRVRKDYSYSADSYWRPGMVLIGDAACFVDPVFSSGVHLATYSALLAARSINSVLDARMNERAAFEEFESRYRQEYGNIYEFLVSFYDTHVDEASYFWTAKKITQYPATDLEAFVRLVSGVSSGEGALSGSAEGESCSEKPADWDTGREMRFALSPEEMGGTRLIAEGADVLGEPAENLAISDDGMYWVVPA